MKEATIMMYINVACYVNAYTACMQSRSYIYLRDERLSANGRKTCGLDTIVFLESRLGAYREGVS